MSGINQVPIPVSPAAQAWTGVPNSTDMVVFWNQDLNNTVYLGYISQITANGNNTIPLPPNQSFPLPASKNVFVIGKVTGIASLVVVPGGGTPFRGLTQGLGSLVIPSIFSPNFITEVSGWTINKDGSAEFNNLTIRGTFFGTNFIINALGVFLYNGTPGIGNPPIIALALGNLDPFGNTIKGSGLLIADPTGTDYLRMVAGNPPRLEVATGDSSEAVPGRIVSGLLGAGPTRSPSLQVQAPRVTGQSQNEFAISTFFSQSADLSQPAGWNAVVSDATHTSAIVVGPSEIDFSSLLVKLLTGPLGIIDQSAPATPTGQTLIYSSSGHVLYAAEDGNDYDTGHITVNATGQVVNAVAFTPLLGLAVPVGAGITYNFKLKLVIKANANAGQWSVNMTGPAVSSLNYQFGFTSAAGVTALNGNVTAFSSTFSGPGVSVLGFYWIIIDGQVTPSANGTLAFNGMTSIGADTFNVFSGSQFTVEPQV